MIKVSGVSKRFGRQTVLDKVSLYLHPGETTAIVGPSGVGKSVLLKLIMGIMEPDEGEIWIEDRCMSKAKSEEEKNDIRSNLGVLFQAAALFDSLNVYDNIAFPLRERCHFSRRVVHEKVLAMLEALSLTPYAFNYPEEISIGIRKRVGMARALVTEPKILLFDEQLFWE
jgi:phospholipid/cholesterol/gamma-HCH transport system ATP-binding protein